MALTTNVKGGIKSDRFRMWSYRFKDEQTHIPFYGSMEDLAALGIAPGLNVARVLGFNDAIAQGSFEDVWAGGGVKTYLGNGVEEKINVASDNAADDAAGTGARTIFIEGLDANHEPVSETVIMDGTSNVLTTNNYHRVNFVTVITAAVHASIPVATATDPGANRSQLSHFTVPAKCTGLMKALDTSILGSGQVAGEFSLMTRPAGADQVFSRTWIDGLDSRGTGSNHRPLVVPVYFPEKTDIKFVYAATDAAARVSVNYVLMLLAEDT